MRVLKINAVAGIRSTGRTCTQIADYLNQNGHEGYIAYTYGLPYTKGYVVGTNFERKLHALQSRIWGLQGYFSKTGTKNLIKYIEKIEPDVVQLHNLHSNYINLEMLLGFLAKNDIPTVLALHDCWFYTGKCTHYTVDGCQKWQQQCGGCPRLKKDNPSWFFDKTTQMLNDKAKWFGAIPRLAVVGVSDWITNEARKSILKSAKIITRIYNWIDMEAFKPADTAELRKKLGLQKKFVLLGVASGWSNAKGLNKFIEIAGKVPTDTMIILVGGMKSTIKLPRNIIHITETHDIGELVQYYSLADVYLNLSLEETFGKTTGEALACGTPVIVLNSTANPELVGRGCGFVVEKDDQPALWEKICIIKSEGKRAFSDACLKQAKTHFERNQNISQIIQLYQKLVN